MLIVYFFRMGVEYVRILGKEHKLNMWRQVSAFIFITVFLLVQELGTRGYQSIIFFLAAHKDYDSLM